MAKEAADKMPKVLFKRYDADNNADKYDIQYYPTVVLYQKGKKKKMSSFSRKNFIAFYEKHGSFEWTEFEQEKKERLRKKERQEAKLAKKKAAEEQKQEL